MRPKWFVLLVWGMFFLLISVAPVHADVAGGGFTAIRREFHRETGDFRLVAELYAPGYRDAYWAWLSGSEELLKAPNVGSVKLSFILVTEDGKPVRYAKWTNDQRKETKDWEDLKYGPNGFELDYPLDRARPGVHTVHFVGGIKDGQRNYTKVWLLVDLTIGGRKKTRYQTEALQFMVYDLPVGRNRVDPQLLVNSQEEMAAGGSSLIGPAIEEDEPEPADKKGKRQPTDTPSRQERSNLILSFNGFTSWAHVVWDTGKESWCEVSGTKTVTVPRDARAVDVYIVNSDGEQGGYRIKNSGALRSFDVPTDGRLLTITVNRTRRGG